MSPQKVEKKLEQNAAELHQTETSLADAAAGFVAGAKLANTAGSSAIVAKELDLAAAALPNPTPSALQAAEKRVQAALQNLDSAGAEYSKAWQHLEFFVSEKRDLLEQREKLHQQYESVLAGKLAAEETLRKGAEARAALVKTVIRSLMILGAATAIAAVLAFRLFPSFALPLAALSGVAFGLAYLAAIIQPWMIYTLGGLVILVGGALAFYAYRERRLANGAIGFVQEQRNEDQQWWNSKKDAAREWLGHGKGWLGKEIDRRTSEMNLS